MENNVKVYYKNYNSFVFLLILFGIFTLIFPGVNSGELNTNGKFLPSIV